MELVTGLIALDEQCSEENRYLSESFSQMKGGKESLLLPLILLHEGEVVLKKGGG